MSVPAPETPVAPPVLSASADGKIRRIEWLCIYLLSFGSSLLLSLSFLISGYNPSPELDAMVNQVSPERFLIKIVFAIAALLILYCVLVRRGQSLHSLGFMRPTWSDFIAGVLLAIGAYVATIVVSIAISVGSYFFFDGSFSLSTKTQNVEWVTGGGSQLQNSFAAASIGVLRVIAMLINPVHEEVVARTFTQTEWENGSRWSSSVAAIFSAVLQGAYHLYQGIYAAIGLTAMFLCFAFFFVRKQRVLPIIIAHLIFDALALINW